MPYLSRLVLNARKLPFGGGSRGRLILNRKKINITFLLNLSRGKIVEKETFVKALENRKVPGARLDLLEYEKSSFESFFEQ